MQSKLESRSPLIVLPAVLHGHSLAIILTAMLVVIFAVLPASSQQIRSYNVNAELTKDGTLDVRERIFVDYGGDGTYGVYRIIPVESDSHRYQFKLLDTLLDPGSQSNDAHRIEESDGTAIVQVGNDKKRLWGRHILFIHYLLRKAVNFGATPKLSWDVLGAGWPYPIGSFNLLLHVPPGEDAKQWLYLAMVGPGGQGRPVLASADGQSLRFAATNIAAGESLVVKIDLPPGTVSKPGFAKQFSWFWQDWWPAFLLPVFFALVLGIMRWTCAGSLEAPQLANEELQLPENLAPAELGTLLDDRCDLTDVTATIFDLAARGFLSVEEVKAAGFVTLSNRDYVFRRLRPLEEVALADHEKLLLSCLFCVSPEPRNLATLSAIKTKFHDYGPKIEGAVYRSLISKGQLLRRPAEIAHCFRAAAYGLAALAVLAVLTAQGALLPLGIGLAASALITFVLAPTMPSRTLSGCKSLRQMKQFRGFLLTAPVDQIQIIMRGESSLFGRFLPYALVLGAADKLAEAFRDVIKEAPTWYRPYYEGTDPNFSVESFVTSLGSGMRTIERTFSLSAVSNQSENAGTSIN